VFGVQIQLIKSELIGRIMLTEELQLSVLTDKEGEEPKFLPLLF